jgi:LmbE family N-acetylglucosaminyl deacetylase
VYGTLLAALYGAWIWVPWEYDFIPRQPPHPNPPVDPDSKSLFAPGTRVLIITAHPDDSEFYIGGTLAKLRDAGAVLHQLILTEGDKSFYGPFTNVAENRKVRKQEAIAAATRLRIEDLVILGYPDGRLRMSDELVARLAAEMERFRPDYVFSFDYDFPPRMSHKDHRETGRAVALAVGRSKSAKWLMRFSTQFPNYVVDITDYWPEEEELLKIHMSQFHGDRLEQVTNMVEYSAIEDGQRIGTSYGEGFRAIPLK